MSLDSIESIAKRLPPEQAAQAQLASSGVLKMLSQQMSNKLPFRMKAHPTLDELLDWVNERLNKIQVVSFVPVGNGFFAVIYQQVD